MPDETTPAETTPAQIVVSGYAGTLDTLYAAGRMLLLIFSAVPVLLTLLGKHDLLSLITYFEGDSGKALLGAVVGLATVVFGLLKSFKRGTQIASVANNAAVPSSVAITKQDAASGALE